MSKNIFNDMKIKKISGGVNKQHLSEDVAPKNDLEIEPRDKFEAKLLNPRKKTNGLLMALLIISIVFGGGYFIATYFESATITLIAKRQPLTFDHESFVANKGKDANLPFEIMILNDKVSKDIILTESQEASSKATGDVVIYNTFSTKPQKLPKNASLSDDSNKIYKIDKQISVPGYTLLKGKIVPGSIQVGVTAETAGEDYNGAPRDFSIVLLKGTTKYKKIYARSKTPLSGGALGVIYIPSATEKGNLNAYAESVFKANMMKKMIAQIPPGYILYPNAQTFSYQIDPNIQSKDPNIKANIFGTFSAIILPENNLMKASIKHSLPDISDDELKEITISDLSKLTFNFVNEGQSITKDMQSVSFTLSGSFEAIWNPNIEVLKKELSSVAKDSVGAIFKVDPGITSAKVIVRPPWQTYIPSDTSKIKIMVQ